MGPSRRFEPDAKAAQRTFAWMATCGIAGCLLPLVFPGGLFLKVFFVALAAVVAVIFVVGWKRLARPDHLATLELDDEALTIHRTSSPPIRCAWADIEQMWPDRHGGYVVRITRSGKVPVPTLGQPPAARRELRDALEAKLGDRLVSYYQQKL